ncbi:MAG: bifunctional nuclease domain-containing protein [Bacteroidota bacterium]
MKNKIKLELLGLFVNMSVDMSTGQSHNNTCTLMLGEAEGERQFPITVDLTEMPNVMAGSEESESKPPLIHDVVRKILKKVGYYITETVITTFNDDEFTAKVFLTNGEDKMVLDTKAVDAISLGLRFQAPLYIHNALLDEAEHLMFKQKHVSKKVPKLASLLSYTKRIKKDPEVVQGCSEETLDRLLSFFLSQEDYEKAVLIRDEMKRREVSKSDEVQ